MNRVIVRPIVIGLLMIGVVMQPHRLSAASLQQIGCETAAAGADLIALGTALKGGSTRRFYAARTASALAELGSAYCGRPAGTAAAGDQQPYTAWDMLKLYKVCRASFHAISNGLRLCDALSQNRRSMIRRSVRQRDIDAMTWSIIGKYGLNIAGIIAKPDNTLLQPSRAQVGCEIGASVVSAHMAYTAGQMYGDYATEADHFEPLLATLGGATQFEGRGVASDYRSAQRRAAPTSQRRVHFQDNNSSSSRPASSAYSSGDEDADLRQAMANSQAGQPRPQQTAQPTRQAAAQPVRAPAPKPAAPAQTEAPTCTICMDDLPTNAAVVKTLSCKHKFCKACIDPWIASRHTCPVCRARA